MGRVTVEGGLGSRVLVFFSGGSVVVLQVDRVWKSGERADG